MDEEQSRAYWQIMAAKTVAGALGKRGMRDQFRFSATTPTNTSTEPEAKDERFLVSELGSDHEVQLYAF